MELRELRLIVSRYLPVAFVVFALCVAAGFAAAFLPVSTYRTSATIVLDLNNDPELGGVSVQQATFLLPAIEQRATSVSMRERAANDVPEVWRVVRVDMEAVSDSSVLRIRGTSTSPQAAQAWVNAIADRLVEEQSPDSPVVLSVLDSAPLKRRPIAPHPEPIMGAFIVIGLIAALFSTLAADRIKKAFDTHQTVRERLGTTVLGEVPAPRQRTDRRRPIVSLLSDRDGSPAVTSAFETIRTNMEFRMAQLGADRVAVVSAQQHLGKSTVAAGISYSMAAVGRDVVAVEADLRRPELSEQLGVRPLTGLGEIATFGLDALVLHSTHHQRLQVVPSGLLTGRAADVVSTCLPPVLDQIDDGSRTIVVDCPPLRGAPESAIVISSTKYVVLVVNNNSAELSQLPDAIESIDDLGGVLLGVVINGVSQRRARSQQGMDTGVSQRPGGGDDQSFVAPAAGAVSE